jgi:hypothetical protein
VSGSPVIKPRGEAAALANISVVNLLKLGSSGREQLP